MSNKQDIIDRILRLLRPPDERLEIAVFRDSNCAYPYEEGRVKMHAPEGFFYFGEVLHSKSECLKIPAKKHLFVIHSDRPKT